VVALRDSEVENEMVALTEHSSDEKKVCLSVP